MCYVCAALFGGRVFAFRIGTKRPQQRKKPFFAVEHRPTWSGTQDNRQPRQAFAPYLIGRAPTRRGSVSAVPLCRSRTKSAGRQAERQTSRAAAAACVGKCFNVHHLSPWVFLPPLKSYAKVLLFSHIRKRAQEKNTKNAKKLHFVRFFFVGLADLRENRRYSDFSTNRVRRTHNRT